MEMDLDNLKKALDLYGKDFVAELVATMKSYGSLNLWKDIDYNLYQTANELSLVIEMPQEVYYASEGRAAGKFPPIEPIKKWAEEHGLPQFRDKKGRFASYNMRAYLIAKKIAAVGTKQNAKHFLKEFQIKDKTKQELIKYYRQDVKLYIEKLTLSLDSNKK